jgi:hypothetical protein
MVALSDEVFKVTVEPNVSNNESGQASRENATSGIETFIDGILEEFEQYV